MKDYKLMFCMVTFDALNIFIQESYDVKRVQRDL